MVIKRKLLYGATISFCALALSVPMSFAACPVASDCDCQNQEIVTPDTATCSKCKKQNCECKKKSFNFNPFKKSDCGCETGAAAPCDCDPCEKPKNDCGCETGAAAPCIETKPLNQQTYAYPSSVYSNSNSAQVGEMLNNATINDADSLLTPNRGASANCACTGAAAPIYRGVPVECGCPTGGAAPIINADEMPKYDCNVAPNVH
ncbi:MAG: hypothetical protein IJW73_05215 [Candidatus Gastranaerophilales bacterium]|nr:hypothetical protein [Candidatus Gastranaerophilales bacterium]